MEENEYKAAYNDLTTIRCVFEKALTNHQAKCKLSQHFCLADREGYACEDLASSIKCREYLEKIRKNSLFVLKIREAKSTLPHNMEIRVQAGGLVGLAKQVVATTDNSPAPLVVTDINQVIKQALSTFGSLDTLPYSQIIQSVVQFQGRKRRRRG